VKNKHLDTCATTFLWWRLRGICYLPRHNPILSEMQQMYPCFPA
jgi:hypothetical protein